MRVFFNPRPAAGFKIKIFIIYFPPRFFTPCALKGASLLDLTLENIRKVRGVLSR